MSFSISMPRRPGLRIMALALLFSNTSSAQSKAPAVSVPSGAGFQERDVSLSSGSAQLSATLTLPSKQNGRLPGVVFVGGAEPQPVEITTHTEDMFSDLARELAKVGIASLRYQQRPFQFSAPPDATQLPLDQQIANDAVVALRYLSNLREVDRLAIFVIGHDVGGTVAPYISERIPHTRGAVLMAGAAQPVEKTLAERRKSTLQAQGVSSQEIAEQLAAQNKIFADIRSGKLPSSRLVEGATVAYWRDRMNRDPGLKARDLQLPVLVLQGGLDKEVTEADYERLQSVLGKKKDVPAEFRWFPNLNHLFMHMPATPSNNSAAESGHVDPVVIQTIASWIRSQLPQHSDRK